MSSNTNIGNTPVNQGYVQLIHTGETGGIDGTLRTLYDGDGTASDLQIASNKVKVSTELFIVVLEFIIKVSKKSSPKVVLPVTIKSPIPLKPKKRRIRCYFMSN